MTKTENINIEILSQDEEDILIKIKRLIKLYKFVNEQVKGIDVNILSVPKTDFNQILICNQEHIPLLKKLGAERDKWDNEHWNTVYRLIIDGYPIICLNSELD